MASRETGALVTARAVTRRYGEIVALRELDLVVHAGEILALLGPSGSGKSTLLRCIAGLEIPDEGEIFLHGKEITRLPPHRRGFGMMFQNFALFPHRNVAENVAFGLKMQGYPPAERARRVTEMLDLVGLQGYGSRSVFELSGGEQQRVALARSLAPEPPLLMLDEPLGALDRRLRERLMDELRVILKEIGMTAIYVTHDQQEAFAISDRLVLLDQGRKVQEGTPEEVYRGPVNRFAAEFFGLHNIFEVLGAERARHDREASRERRVPGVAWEVRTVLGVLRVVSEREPAPCIVIRPEAARLAAPGERTGPNILSGRVCERSFRGGHYRIVTEHRGAEGEGARHEGRRPEGAITRTGGSRAGLYELEWEIGTPDQDLPHPGEEIHLLLRSDAISFLDD